MNLKIVYLKKANKFFLKNSHLLSEDAADQLLIKAAKKIILKEDINIDLKQLKGEYKHLYRIRQNKIRILFEIHNDEIILQMIVEDIDFRGDVYK
jgi:mRNA interferase RelE/StbE